MSRIIAALFLLLASAAGASAQGLFPSVWQSQRGGAAEDFGGRPCYGKFHGSFRQRSGGHLSGSSL
jgi:hypothetical protein